MNCRQRLVHVYMAYCYDLENNLKYCGRIEVSNINKPEKKTVAYNPHKM